MTKASISRLARRKRGRPKGSTIPLERNERRHEIAIWNGFRLCGYGPTVSAYWAALVTSDQPIEPKDVEGLLTAAGTAIPYTAATLETHIARLARDAKRVTVEYKDDFWLVSSALAIKSMILAARIGNTQAYCCALDVLRGLDDWHATLNRLHERVIAASKSNVPPYEGGLGRQGRATLDWLRSAMEEKPK